MHSTVNGEDLDLRVLVKDVTDDMLISSLLPNYLFYDLQFTVCTRKDVF